MKVTETKLSGLLLIQPDVYKDKRGFFLETWHKERYEELGIPGPFVQDNFSHSASRVLRGLHYQLHHPQGKLVYVTRGKVFDVAVDIRKGSPTFGKWFGTILSDENNLQLYVPTGFAHGFCVLSEFADFVYKCTDFYYPGDEFGVRWNDPKLGIKWPVENPVLSDKDFELPVIESISDHHLPSMGA